MRLLWLTVLGAAALGCDDAPLAPPARPPGQWLAGDLHVHATGASNDTRGMSFPREIARVARERGLRWLVLTDHSNATGSDVNSRAEDPARYNQGDEFPYADECARITAEGALVMVDGNEVSPVWTLADDAGAPQPRGHLGCIPPADLMGFRARTQRFAFTDRPPGVVRGGDNVAVIHGLGAWVVLEHPHAVTPHIAYDWSSRDYDAIEVFNGTVGYDPGDEAARASWLCDLALGRNVVPVGGSDCHEAAVEYPGGASNPAIGFPTTSVFSATSSWPAIADGLHRGRVVVHTAGSFVALWLPRAGASAAMPGDRVSARVGESLAFELEGTAAVPMTVTLWRTPEGSCRDTRREGASGAPMVATEAVFRQDVGEGRFRLTAPATASSGAAWWHAELHAQGAAGFERDVALTHAVRVSAER